MILKHFRLALLGALGFSFLGGCASTPSGEAFSKLVDPQENAALLYLYRPDEHYGQALKFAVAVDSQQKGDIGNGAYMIIPLDPGKRVIRIHGFGYEDVPLEIDAIKGTLTFLKIVTVKGLGGFSATLTLEPEDRLKAGGNLVSLKREPERYVDKDL
jgi:hypothetical protein